MKRYRPDVIHGNDLPTHQIVSDAARGLGVPRICHHRFPYGRAAIDWFNKFGAESYVFVSLAAHEEMCGRLRTIVADRRSVVHDGLSLPARTDVEERRRARIELGLPPERVVVTFAGQIIECKGVADLIRAWSFLDAGRGNGPSLIIGGTTCGTQGGYREQMQSVGRPTYIVRHGSSAFARTSARG